jgi:glucuronate isomerase
MLERHIDNLFDSTGLRGEHHHPITEVDGLIEIVGDEQRRLFSFFMDAHQLDLQHFAGLGATNARGGLSQTKQLSDRGQWHPLPD